MDLLTLAAKVENYGVVGNLKSHGVTVTLSGLIIVFSMLVFLVFVLVIFGSLMERLSGKPKKEKSVKVNKVEPKPVVAAPVVNNAVSADEDEIIAAISAAVMMMYEGTGTTPVIRSIRPAQTSGYSAWKMAGIMNNTRSF
ncbi:MAG: OadG family protein [Clostridia bacterium]|nr:OadG family protein [Clostridia bacterium]